MKSKKVLLIALSLGMIFPGLKVNEAMASEDDVSIDTEVSQEEPKLKNDEGIDQEIQKDINDFLNTSDDELIKDLGLDDPEDIDDIVDDINNGGNDDLVKELEKQIEDGEFEEGKDNRDPKQKEEDEKVNDLEKKKAEALKELSYLVSDPENFQQFTKKIKNSKDLAELNEEKLVAENAIGLYIMMAPKTFLESEKKAIEGLINLSSMNEEQKQSLKADLATAENNEDFKEIRKAIIDFIPEKEEEKKPDVKPEDKKPENKPEDKKEDKKDDKKPEEKPKKDIDFKDIEVKAEAINRDFVAPWIDVNLKELKISRDKAVETVKSAKFLMKNYPNTIKKVRPQLERLVEIQEKLIREADPILKRYNLI